MNPEQIAIKGTLTIRKEYTDGRVEEWTEQNLVVDKGKYNMARLLGGNTASRSVTTIGFGTNGDTAAASDESLTSSYTKAVDGVSYPDSTSVQFAWSLGTSEANGKAIREFGLLHANGNLFSRRVRDVINKTSDFSLTGTWKIQF